MNPDRACYWQSVVCGVGVVGVCAILVAKTLTGDTLTPWLQYTFFGFMCCVIAGVIAIAWRVEHPVQPMADRDWADRAERMRAQR